jgi:transcriptional regulator with GAF, ATPase, and Fis domain
MSVANFASNVSDMQKSAPSAGYKSAPAAGGHQVPAGEARMVGSSLKFRRMQVQVETVAPTDSAVLINGETGTGKELIARAIHDLSPRRSAPFVKLNCAAIPAGLLESELFGHERGAYTGAVSQTVGRFQLANRGTLFLDEIGDLPLELQPKLLRVLQEQEFERLGSTHTIRVDVRIVAATNQDLAAMVRERQFRADLYYRLNVFPIKLPPLRERQEDIPALVHHFVHKFAARMNKSIEAVPAEVMDVLKLHDWPGNIRELQNFVERAVIMSASGELRPSLEELKQLMTSISPAAVRTLAEAERSHILEALRAVRWVVGGPKGAASRLGLPRSTLIYRMRKLGITRGQLSLAS